MLLNVFETVDKIRSALLAHKCSPQMLQVQTAVKQVTPRRIKAKSFLLILLATADILLLYVLFPVFFEMEIKTLLSAELL